MTIDERASDALYEACEEMLDRPNAERLVAAAIREAVNEAVAEERDAIAITIDHWGRIYGGHCGEMFHRLAEVIRARASTHPEPPPAANPPPLPPRHGGQE
jgi:hypothetical protein